MKIDLDVLDLLMKRLKHLSACDEILGELLDTGWLTRVYEGMPSSNIVELNEAFMFVMRRRSALKPEKPSTLVQNLLSELADLQSADRHTRGVARVLRYRIQTTWEERIRLAEMRKQPLGDRLDALSDFDDSE